jgi:hypothetical protein
MPQELMVSPAWPRTRIRQERLADSTGRSLEPARRRRRLGALGLAMVVGIFAIRAVLVVHATSPTIDEVTYLSRALFTLSTGGDAMFWRLGTPRLPHLLSALPSYFCLRNAGLLPRSADYHAFLELVRSGEHLAFRPARYVAVGWGISLLIVTYHGVAATRGARAGLVATALLAMVPEVLAHSAIAGCDLPFACAAMLTVIALARYAERPTPRGWLAVALCVGFSWMVRHSAVVLVPLAALVHLVSLQRRVWPDGWAARARGLVRSAGAAALLATIALVVSWAGDGLGLVSNAEAFDQRPSESISPPEKGAAQPHGLKVPNSIASLFRQLNHQRFGHQGYFCGARRWTGFRTYFPVAMALKTPAGLLVLMIHAAACARPACRYSAVSLVLLGLTWCVLIFSKVNIGVRYGLITYPLVVPFVAELFQPNRLRDRLVGVVASGALLWFAASSLGCHPHYLSYFNELGGGPSRGWLYLSDSNIDWGQDHDELLQTLKRHGIREVTTAVFGTRLPNDPQLRVTEIPARGLPAADAGNTRLIPQAAGTPIPIATRYVAVSVTRFHRLYSDHDLNWLLTRRLVERVGASIWIFDMDQPADHPFLL